MKVAVIGAGKMGLPLACAFASRGAQVIACDVNADVVRAINDGEMPFEEPGMPELLTEVVGGGRLRATTDNNEAITESEVCVVIVPVHLTDTRSADLSIIESVSTQMAESLKPGSLVSYETTLPVGQTRKLGALIETGGLKAGVDFDLVFSPERVKSQKVLRHLFDIPKVVGGLTPEAGVRGAAFYKEYLGAPVTIVESLEAAEFVKLAGMVYRDVNIALANELAGYAEQVGLDFEAVRSAANTDGEAAILIPGIGVGGHCTPVYPHFLISEARSRGETLRLVETGRRINDERPSQVLDRVGDLSGKRVLILGLSFRPQVKAAAYSPAFALAEEIRKRGGEVRVHDPLYSDDEVRQHGFEPGDFEGHEVIVLNTAHEIYASLDFERLARGGARTIVDGRNVWNPERVRAAGLDYVGIGRPPA